MERISVGAHELSVNSDGQTQDGMGKRVRERFRRRQRKKTHVDGFFFITFFFCPLLPLPLARWTRQALELLSVRLCLYHVKSTSKGHRQRRRATKRQQGRSPLIRWL